MSKEAVEHIRSKQDLEAYKRWANGDRYRMDIHSRDAWLAACEYAASTYIQSSQELHEYGWELLEMVGREPSERDIWVAGGFAGKREDAEQEAMHYLSQYANDDTGFRFDVFEVTRRSLGGLARMPDA